MQAYLAPIGLCVARSEIRSSRRSTLEAEPVVTFCHIALGPPSR